MAKKEVNISNAAILKAVNKALAELGASKTTKAMSINIAFTIDCPTGWEPALRPRNGRLEEYCKKIAD